MDEAAEETSDATGW